MHAVIKSGGHQYRVKEGQAFDIQKIEGSEGDKVEFDQVLMIGDKIGAPLVSGAKVQATIKKQYRDEKVWVFKYKRRKNYKKLRGHRQPLTTVEVNKITG